ncbi:type II toxin-antitoxin system RelE/ParE family toxin [candidate division KSB1 bacterium]
MKKQKSSSNWKIEFKKSAAKELKNLPGKDKKLVWGKIKTKLISDPYIGEKMAGKFKNLWRLRVGVYRIIYEIQKENVVILVLKIADRKDSYGLPS